MKMSVCNWIVLLVSLLPTEDLLGQNQNRSSGQAETIVAPGPWADEKESAENPAELRTKAVGLFIGDDSLSPLVLQIEERAEHPGSLAVRGMGTCLYSTDDSTPIQVEFRGIGSFETQTLDVRGALRFIADGQRLTTDWYFPWYGQFDHANGSWRLMVTPTHVLSTSRPGQKTAESSSTFSNQPTLTVKDGFDSALVTDVQRHNADASTVVGETPIGRGQVSAENLANRLRAGYIQTVMSVEQMGNERRKAAAQFLGVTSSSQKHSDGTNVSPPAIDPFQDYLDNGVLVLAAIFRNEDYSRYLDRVFAPIKDVKHQSPSHPASPTATASQTLTPRSTTTGGPNQALNQNQAPIQTQAPPLTQASNQTPAATPGDPFAGLLLDDVLAVLRHHGVRDDRIESVLVPAPDPSRAWQVSTVTRLPDGRIQIVNYDSGPDGPNGTGLGSSGASGAGNSSGRQVPNGNQPVNPPVVAGQPGNTISGNGSTGTAGTPPSNTGGVTTSNAHGTNNVSEPSDPPTPPPPTTPGAPTNSVTPPPPAPPVATAPPTRSAPIRRGAAGNRSDQVYDPNITVLVNEDSGQAPTAPLSASQIEAATAALDRNMVANSVAPSADNHRSGVGTMPTSDGSTSGLTAAQINAARAALTRVEGHGIHVQPKGPGMEGNHQVGNGASTDRERRGFQLGDAAAIGSDFREGSITPGGSLSLSGHLDRGHEGMWFNIFRGPMPADIEDAIKHNQEYWTPPTPQQDDDATVTLHRFEMSDTEGVLHFVREVHVNAEATSCAYFHFVVYHGFLIEYGHNVSGRVVHDVGRDWPTVLRHAQQLIDRRFPAVSADDTNLADTTIAGEESHAVDGIWEAEVPNGIALQFKMTVRGNTVQMAMNPNGESRIAGLPTIEGKISGSDSRFSGALSTPGPNGESTVPFTMTLSSDRKSMTVTTAGNAQTWRRK